MGWSGGQGAQTVLGGGGGGGRIGVGKGGGAAVRGPDQRRWGVLGIGGKGWGM